ncbi:MAG: enoyl-CoA hydratase/isomerase family protein [Solirubrobacteraceae bacterium]|nr:enoyl-CoA hydratase/isomerase family protein [Solirubrobacteraceae bacterium]
MTVRTSVQSGVATITLDVPEQRNALDGPRARAIGDAIDAAGADPAVGAIVVAGAGRGFCSGAVRGLLERAGDPLDEAARAELDAVYDLFLRVGAAPVPTIAAVHGAAVGAGFNLALSTDVTVVAHDARLISGFARIGVHPGGGHLHLLRRRAGHAAAAAIGLLDREIDGDRAVALGLAWDAVPADRVVERAVELAAAPAADPVLARLTTRTLRRNAADAWAAHVEAERGAQLTTLLRRAAATG